VKILIAEDQPIAAESLRRTLALLGHEVSVAADGAAAWEALQATQISLLISDWVMPRMNGVELCQRVRAGALDRYVYTILLTSKDRREDRLKGLRAGADDFLTKPLDPDELAVRLEVAGRILGVHEELARRNARLAELASIDGLTGVKNRRRFHEELDTHFALWVRKGTPLSLVLLDLDHFKQYNDTFGHPAGDEVLRAVAGLLEGATRECDVAARYGGEEFAVLLPATGADGAAEIAERLRERIELAPWALWGVTASLGVATADGHTRDGAALVEAADRALYDSKRSGRNRVTRHRRAVWSPTGA